MKKKDLIEKLADIGDEDEVLIAIITPKDDEEDKGYEMGSSDGTEPDADSEDDEDDSFDNGDGTVTNLEPIYDVSIAENTDPETQKKELFATIDVDMVGLDDEDDEDEDDESDENDVEGSERIG